MENTINTTNTKNVIKTMKNDMIGSSSIYGDFLGNNLSYCSVSHETAMRVNLLIQVSIQLMDCVLNF